MVSKPWLTKLRYRCSVRPIDPTLKILCDRDRLVQVMTNLIGNAVKFSPAGEAVTVFAEIIEREDGQHVRLNIRDTGPGIAPLER